jgi:hypothetical protein
MTNMLTLKNQADNKDDIIIPIEYPDYTNKQTSFDSEDEDTDIDDLDFSE